MSKLTIDAALMREALQIYWSSTIPTGQEDRQAMEEVADEFKPDLVRRGPRKMDLAAVSFIIAIEVSLRRRERAASVESLFGQGVKMPDPDAGNHPGKLLIDQDLIDRTLAHLTDQVTPVSPLEQESLNAAAERFAGKALFAIKDGDLEVLGLLLTFLGEMEYQLQLRDQKLDNSARWPLN